MDVFLDVLLRVVFFVVTIADFLFKLFGLEKAVPEPDKETILLVHGTFAAPKPGIAQWYQPQSDFCQALDAAMACGGSSARCWHHLAPGEGVFHWDGQNNWFSRMRAAQALAAEVLRLRTLGWRCHIVTHSHGGNVALEAYRLFGLSHSRGLIVLLGCPIISYKDRKLRLPAVVMAVLTTIVFFHFRSGTAALVVASVRAHFRTTAMLVAGLLVWFVVAFAVTWMIKVLSGSRELIGLQLPHYPHVFHFSSKYDEAHIFLKTIREMENPIRADVSTLQVPVVTSLQSAYRIDATTYGRGLFNLWYLPFWGAYIIAGWAAFDGSSDGWLARHSGSIYALFVYALVGMVADRAFAIKCILLPWRTIAVSANAIKTMVLAAIAPMTLRWAWNQVVRASLGILGSPLRTREVTIGVEYLHFWPDTPKYKGSEMNLCPIEVPAALVSVAMQRQSDQSSALLAGLLDIYRNGLRTSVSRDSLGKVLSKLEMELVHSIYYSEPKIIQAIGAVLSVGPDMGGLLAEEVRGMQGSTGSFDALSYREAIMSFVEKRCGW